VGFDSGPVEGRLLTVDRADPRPLHEQIEQALRAGIRSGRLGAGARLPSTRGLSVELGISRGVVTAAYGQLAAEGYLVTRPGAPVRVSTAIRGAHVRPAARTLERDFAYDMRPGLPDLAGFPRHHWQRSLSAAWRRSRPLGSASSTRAGFRSCATRWRSTSTGCAAPPPTPSS
jgi:GntR family transcriptional regulator/MocR family aminotransferase